tara:strand:+ start:730 stop:1266 length:537 start_codon:yes stop_codon:yes gene_type:complete
VRIIRGKYRGKRIVAPTRLPVRPTTDFAKEALFNIIENMFHIEQLKVLDLFCGTGNISFEFASRGAEDILSVDKHFGCIRFVFDTAKSLEFDQLRTYKADAFKFIEKTEESFDLIFADPPYALKNLSALPDLIIANNLLAQDGILILEHGDDIQFENHPNLLMHRKYSSVNFSFFKPE